MKISKTILLSPIIIFGFVINSYSQIFIGNTEIDTTSIVTSLDTPWEILWGPDDYIWLTERYGRISRLNPETGVITELITIGDVYESGESGLLGMVLHPDFVNHPYVYVVYNYLDSGDIKERLVRYTYSGGVLSSPLTLLEGIDGQVNHDGSRLVIDSNQKLFMTTGDALSDATYPQSLTALNGKVLRMNLDGSVPDDNPISGSYIWTWGHRNPQGLVISPLGIMYSSEHGPSSDDEVNIIEKGRNYGWPYVLGFCDEPTEMTFCADSNVMEPIAAWTPTLAVAGTDFYHQGAIPEWQNTLLVTSLKASRVTALELSPDGRSVINEASFFQDWWGRLRDICISPDGRVFLAVSNRDGRGTVRDGDDRIVEITALSNNQYCNKEESVTICPGDIYNFYGREISQPGIYSDTVSNALGCDTIVSLTLSLKDAGSIGLEESVMMALGDTVTLTANEGFISYQWNNDPSLNGISVTIIASDLGVGTHYYTVDVEDIDGCNLSDTVKVTVTYPVNVRERGILEFSVYPNPVTGNELNITYSIESEARLSIFSMDGKEVSGQILYPENNSLRIELPETRGLYNIIITNNNGTSYVKVLKL